MGVTKHEGAQFYKRPFLCVAKFIYAWAHWTWQIQSFIVSETYDPLDLDAEWDAYVSVKLEGPAYVKDSKKKNAFSVDRFLFVKAIQQQAPAKP